MLMILVVCALTVVTLWVLYAWLLGQTIYQTMYHEKAGVDYWATWTLENNIFTASLLLAAVSMVTLPQRSTLLTFFSTMSGVGQRLKVLSVREATLWRFLEFLALFVAYVSVGGYALTGQNVAFLMMLMEHGAISLSSEQLSTLFYLPFSPGTPAGEVEALIPAMEAYQLYLGIVGTLLMMTAARLALSVVTDYITDRPDLYVMGVKLLLIGALASVLELLSVPMWTVNAGTWMTLVTLIIVFFSCLLGALMLGLVRFRSGGPLARIRAKIAALEADLERLHGELVVLRSEYGAGAVSSAEYNRRVRLLMEDRENIADELRRLKIERLLPVVSRRRFVAVAAVLAVLCVSVPAIQAMYYGVQMEGDKYVDWKFNYETRKEIAVTDWAAGLSDMQYKTLEDLTSNATPESEVEFLTSVRQWDQTASYLRMKNQIGTNWMTLADSDIVYLHDHEYWVSPLTFDTSATSTSFINQHLIYTHTEGLVVLDAYSGAIVEHDSLVALLNRTDVVNVYYGEGPGFGDVVFVNVPGFEEVGNTSFAGGPDYVLRGFESAFYVFNMGPEAWSFIGRDLDMLVERDVVSRVNNILLQGLRADSDPYIVVGPSGEVYYAVSVFIDYPLSTGYAHEAYLRFLGVVLVDVATGVMHFYRSPTQDSPFFIDRAYSEYYDWEDAPAWLQKQMKWPEDLFERQLEVAYIMHVTDGLVWRSGVDFHESPEGSDTRYIIMRVGGVRRFVATHNSEFRDAPGRNLAGIYMVGCGEHDFGQLTFFSAGQLGYSTLLGPNAAVQAFETAEEVRTQLQLWGSHRYGNRLLYHLGGDLFFVIPVFLEVETSQNRVIQKLGGVGLVDARTGERVTLGRNVVEAYYDMFGLLNQTAVEPGAVGFESAVLNPVTVGSGSPSSMDLVIRNNDDVSHHVYVDISFATGNFTVNWHGHNVAPTVYPQNTTFSLDIGPVGPGDMYGTSPLVTPHLPHGLVLAQYIVVVTLRTEEGVVDQVQLLLTVTQS